jgi:hypothetical protein
LTSVRTTSIVAECLRLRSRTNGAISLTNPLPVDPALDKFIMERHEQRAKALADQEAQPTLFTDLK